MNFDPRTGLPQAKMTNQGHADESTWSRGQAWSVMGFAQTYTWTKDKKHLETAIKCAEYFLGRLEEAQGKWHHPLVPKWDFDAQFQDPKEPLRDVSAGVITANGLFIIHQSLQSLPSSIAEELSGGKNYLEIAMQIVGETLDMALDQDLASFEAQPSKIMNGTGANVDEEFKIRESRFDGILKHSTANYNEHAHMKYWDHGLVYADYFLMEFGNKLLRAGLV